MTNKYVKLTSLLRYKAVKTRKKKVNPVKKKQILTEKKEYTARCRAIVKNLDLSSIPNIEKRQWRKYDLDHIISIDYGYRNNIPAEKISSLRNLRIIPHKENKNKRAAIDESELWRVK